MKVYRSKHRGSYLFQSLNFIDDLSEVFFRGQRGPDSGGYVVQYYDENESEASEMIQGMGKYAKKMFGSNFAKYAFTEMHWAGNQEWKWKSSENKFFTPAAIRLEMKVLHDDNMAIMAEEEVEETQIVPAQSEGENRLGNLLNNGNQREESTTAEGIEANNTIEEGRNGNQENSNTFWKQLRKI